MTPRISFPVILHVLPRHQYVGGKRASISDTEITIIERARKAWLFWTMTQILMWVMLLVSSARIAMAMEPVDEYLPLFFSNPMLVIEPVGNALLLYWCHKKTEKSRGETVGQFEKLMLHFLDDLNRPNPVDPFTFASSPLSDEMIGDSGLIPTNFTHSYYDAGLQSSQARSGSLLLERVYYVTVKYKDSEGRTKTRQEKRVETIFRGSLIRIGIGNASVNMTIKPGVESDGNIHHLNAWLAENYRIDGYDGGISRHKLANRLHEFLKTINPYLDNIPRTEKDSSFFLFRLMTDLSRSVGLSNGYQAQISVKDGVVFLVIPEVNLIALPSLSRLSRVDRQFINDAADDLCDIVAVIDACRAIFN